MSYPLGSIFIRIPNDKPHLKHLFSVLVSTFYLIPVLNLWTGTLQLLADIVGTWLIARNVKSSNMPWIVFVYVTAYMLTVLCRKANATMQTRDGPPYCQVRPFGVYVLPMRAD